MALFINHYHFSIDQFDRLTPVQAYKTLDKKQELDEFKYLFWSDQFRLNNFYTIKYSMADTKRIKKPSDLYPLQHDQKEYTPKQIEYFSRKLTAKEKELIRSL